MIIVKTGRAAILRIARRRGGSKLAHLENPKSPLVHFLFGIRKLLGVARFALVIVLLSPKLLVLFDHPRNASFSALLFEGRDYILKRSAPILNHYIPTN